MMFLFEKSVKIVLTNFSPSLDLNNKSGFLSNGLRIFAKEFVIVIAFLFLRGIVQSNFEELSITIKIYLYPLKLSRP